MSTEVRIGKQHYVLINAEMRDWLNVNVGKGGWVAGELLDDDYEWGVWWCMGSGGVVFKHPEHAAAFKVWLP